MEIVDKMTECIKTTNKLTRMAKGDVTDTKKLKLRKDRKKIYKADKVLQNENLGMVPTMKLIVFQTVREHL